MARTPRNLGFDGRIFLEEAEWQTYCRRKPVRYIRTAKSGTCAICPDPVSAENPLQSAHIIGFHVGVIELGLTPEFLDSAENIVIAHRRTCNRQSELDLEASMERLRGLGVRELPKFLPAATHKAWDASGPGA